MIDNTQYVQLSLHVETLQRLIAAQALHADEVMCKNKHSMHLLKRVLLNALIGKGSVDISTNCIM